MSKVKVDTDTTADELLDIIRECLKRNDTRSAAAATRSALGVDSNGLEAFRQECSIRSDYY